MQLLLICLLISTGIYASTDHPHRVESLPGAPAEPSFPLYSGRISVNAADFQGVFQHNIFYVLCESIRADPLEAPLVVWLNGGPGASSLIGLFQQHGPYILDNATGKLRYNDFSWNQYANVLYIETPSRVGFSNTSKPRAEQGPDKYHDEPTADLNMHVLEAFMTRVHPRYATRDFFIAGASYAGAYVPYLSLAVLNGLQNGNFSNANFKGIALGNPGMDKHTRWLSAVMQMFAMGMIPQKYGSKIFELWQMWQESEEDGTIHMGKYYQLDFVHEEFRYLHDAVNDDILYNLYAFCEEDHSSETWHIAHKTKDIECNLKIGVESYLNNYDVQKSLHAVDESNVTIKWTAINRAVHRDFYQADDTTYLYREIFNLTNDNFRVLFYSGDLDLAIPAIHVARGTAIIAKRNDLEEVGASPKIWRYLDDFGGALTSYKSNSKNISMDVLTVRGAGHMVPMNQPGRAFQIINNFLFSTESPIDYSKKIRRRPLVKQ